MGPVLTGKISAQEHVLCIKVRAALKGKNEQILSFKRIFFLNQVVEDRLNFIRVAFSESISVPLWAIKTWEIF